jgi:Mg2+/Co2+ transporter CorC
MVNNGMLINLRENQRGHDKIQSRTTSNIEHILHIAKTKKRKLTIPKTKQMSNT